MAAELPRQDDRRRGSPDRRRAAIDLRRRDLEVAERRLVVRRRMLEDRLFTLAERRGVKTAEVEALVREFRALEAADAHLDAACAAVRERRAFPYGRRAGDRVAR